MACLLQAAELLSTLEALLLTFHQHLCGGYQQRLGSTQVRRRTMMFSQPATCLWQRCCFACLRAHPRHKSGDLAL